MCFFLAQLFLVGGRGENGESEGGNGGRVARGETCGCSILFFNFFFVVFALRSCVGRSFTHQRTWSVMAWHVQAADPAVGMKNQGQRLLPSSAHERPNTSWKAKDSRRCLALRNTPMMVRLPNIDRIPPTKTISARVVSWE